MYLELCGRECPKSQADVQSLVQEAGLRHGDLVSFDEYIKPLGLILSVARIMKQRSSSGTHFALYL